MCECILKGKLNPKKYPIPHTDWEGKKHKYRSLHELDYYKVLDLQKISYETETLKIPYINSISNKPCNAIPDIYIPSENLIIEIKSSMTLDVQIMKDRRFAFNNLGYNFKLILNKKEENIDNVVQYPKAYCMKNNALFVQW